MTNVKVTKENRVYQIDILGHAGNNDVCRAVSTLGFTLMCALDNEGTKDKEIDYRDGEIRIKVEPTEDTEIQIESIINTVMLGYAMLEKGYPENVKIELQE